MENHWICYHTGKPFVPNLDKFGFVYIITNTKTGKAYVGYKQYFMGKKKRPYKWETYMSSSKYLTADIKKIGKKHFTFEVIAEYKNKRSLNYYEMYHQVKYNVLNATLEGSDEQAFYNHCIGGKKFYRPIESYQDPEYLKKLSDSLKGHFVSEETRKKLSERMFGKKHAEETKKKMSEAQKGEKNHMFGKKHTEETRKKMSEANTGEKNPFYGKKHTEETRKKMSEAQKGVPKSEEHKKKLSEANSGEKHGLYKGKAEFYLDDKRMEVGCLSAWCDKNGYDIGAVSRIARTTRDGFIENVNIKGGPKIKRRSLSSKGPLGIITKVRWFNG